MSKKYQERLARSSGFSNKQFKSDFGLKVLKKFGWEEGKGLGKNEDGREECIQQKRRDGNAGLGTEKKSNSEGQWENWWCDVYNTAAQRIAAKVDSENNADPESSDSEAEEEKEKRSAEGGRITAIKSGSRMAGKLKRVLRQEKPVVSQSKIVDDVLIVKDRSTKKRKREMTSDSKSNEDEVPISAETTKCCLADEEEASCKKQRKAEKRRQRLLEVAEESLESPEMA